MPYHTVRQGDCIDSIAAKYGFSCKKLWDLPENSDLKSARKDPNVLLPDDQVFIPEKERRDESAATEARHQFTRKGVPAKLNLRLLRNHEPRADVPYTLDIDGRVVEGTTDGDGWIRERIPVDARHGKLLLDEGKETHELELGHLDPTSEPSGVRSRLRSLGFYAEGPEGESEEGLQLAVKAFQESEGLSASGTVDDQTRSALEKAFGS